MARISRRAASHPGLSRTHARTQVMFQMMEKTHVIGPDAHPVWKVGGGGEGGGGGNGLRAALRAAACTCCQLCCLGEATRLCSPHLQFLTTRAGDIRWNFFKFLVDQGGQPVKVWDSKWDGRAVEAEVQLWELAGRSVHSSHVAAHGSRTRTAAANGIAAAGGVQRSSRPTVIHRHGCRCCGYMASGQWAATGQGGVMPQPIAQRA